MGWLLDKGFSVDQQDLSGQTALGAATQHNRVLVVQLLLERGAQTELGVEGWTPLYLHGRAALVWPSACVFLVVVRDMRRCF